MENFLPICRVCLKTSLEYVNLNSPFKTQQTSTLVDAFEFSTKIDVRSNWNDNLSRYICCSCCNELQISFKFIQKAKISDEKLKCINTFRELDCILNEFNNNNDVADGKDTDSELDDTDEIVSEALIHQEEQQKFQMDFKCFKCNKHFFSQYVWKMHMERNHSNLNTCTPPQNCEMSSSTSIINEEDYKQIYNDTDVNVSDNDDNEIINKTPVPETNYVVENVITEDEMIDGMDNVDADYLIGQMIVVENDLEKAKKEKNSHNFYLTDDLRTVEYLQASNNSKIMKSEESKRDIEPPNSNSIEMLQTPTKKKSFSGKIGKNLVDEILLSGNLTHAGIKPYKCECCVGSRRNKTEEKDKPVKSAQNEKNTFVQCKLCKKLVKNIFSHNNKFHATVVKSSTNSTIPCKVCGKLLKSKNMKAHVDSIHGELKFLCSFCPKIFSNRNNLQSHLKIHNTNREKKFECNICFKKFYSTNLLKMHKKSHSTETFTCELCGKKFLRKISLTLHLKKHNGETIKCKLCSKDFVRARELNIHMRFHTGECPFLCTMCPESFPIKSSLNYHMRRIHLRCKYVCTFCDESFDHPNKLRKHRYDHIGKPFPCPRDACFRAFMGKKDLERHMDKIHKSQLTIQELKTIYEQHDKTRFQLVLSKTESNSDGNVV